MLVAHSLRRSGVTDLNAGRPGESTSVTNIEDLPAGTGQTKQNDINSKLPMFTEG